MAVPQADHATSICAIELRTVLGEDHGCPASCDSHSNVRATEPLLTVVG
jgi:hypothetical protein